MPRRLLPSAWIGALLGGVMVCAETPREIAWIRLPPGAMQPELASDRSGRLHAVWLSGPAGASEVNYASLGDAGRISPPPMRVNSQAGSAIAMGTIRGARIAVSPNGTIHVVWNGSSTASPRPPRSSPLLYARKPAGATGFEAQRNLIAATADLDGGGAVVVDGTEAVHVFWHAGDGQGQTREDRRRVFESVSQDDGKTFGTEHPIDPGDGTGVCGCCGLRAATDSKGRVFVVYRGAKDVVHRGTQLLEPVADGIGFHRRLLQDWTSGACPMSLPALVGRSTGMQFAWETGGRIFGQEGDAPEPTLLVPGPGARHPSMASNSNGETLLVWTEGTGWNRGGSLGWRLFDPKGKPTSSGGTRDDLAVWSYPAVAARPDGSFVIAY